MKDPSGKDQGLSVKGLIVNKGLSVKDLSVKGLFVNNPSVKDLSKWNE